MNSSADPTSQHIAVQHITSQHRAAPNRKRGFRLAKAALFAAIGLAPAVAWAQSDPAGFSTVIEAPPTIVGDDESIGSDTQFNVSDGGMVGDNFSAGPTDQTGMNIEVNVAGGNVGSDFDANSGSVINVSGGDIGNDFTALGGSSVNVSGGNFSEFTARSGSTVNVSGGNVSDFSASGTSTVSISGGTFALGFGDFFAGVSAGGSVDISGGTFGDGFGASTGSDINISGGAFGSGVSLSNSDVELIGGEFIFNGSPVTGPVSLNSRGFLAGTLADGSVFVFTNDGSFGGFQNDILGNVNLTTVALPSIDTTPITIGSSSDSAPNGLRPGQSLTLEGLGSLDNSFSAIGGTLNVNGGEVIQDLDVVDSVVNISGGAIGNGFSANSGSEVDLSSGSISVNFRANSGSTVNVSGGSIGSGFEADQSVINIDGGTIGQNFEPGNGSEVNISGGSIGEGFMSDFSVDLNISGGNLGDNFSTGGIADFIGSDFILNGVPTSGPVTVTGTNAVESLSGTLADGTVFILSAEIGDSLFGVRLNEAELPPIDTSPIVIADAGDAVPNGLRAGQSLSLDGTGSLASGVSFLSSIANITNTTDFAASGATLNINGGAVGIGLEVANSTVNVNEGVVQVGVTAISQSEVNLGSGSNEALVEAFSNSTVNVTGGNFSLIAAESGSAVNISGGNASLVSLGSGSTATISGGSSNALDAQAGSTVSISGGTFRNVSGGFTVDPGSQVELIGGEFLLNGTTTTGQVTLGEGDILTGTLADGSAFIFTEQADEFNDVTLTSVALPTLDTSPINISSRGDSTPNGLRAGQSLTLGGTGALDNSFAAVGASLNIDGGTVGNGLELVDSELNISGGTVGDGIDVNSSTVNIDGGTIGVLGASTSGNALDVNAGSIVNVSGGTVGRGVRVNSGGTINVSDGTVATNLTANAGSTVSISGGTIGDDSFANFTANSGSMVEISGGNFGTSFRAQVGSDVELIGGEFLLNGATPTGPITLASGDTLTGTLADGSAFIFSDETDTLNEVTLTSVALPTANTDPITIDETSSTVPSSLRAGQTLTLQAGSLGENFAAVGASLNISGGDVGASLEVADSQVNISGGAVGDRFNAHAGSIVDISGGTVGDDFQAFSDSTASISGGTIGSRFNAEAGSTVNISGGELGNSARFELNSSVTISGGSLGFNNSIGAGSLELVGGEFLADGSPVTGELNEFVDKLTGTLADGTVFVLAGDRSDSFSGGVSITLTSVALPTLETAPITIADSTDTAPNGLRSGQSLTLDQGGSLGDRFVAVNASLNINGGTVGDSLELVDSTATFTGGNVGDNVRIGSGSTANISGGTFGAGFRARADDSTVNISGGSFQSNFNVNTGTISGGQFGIDFFAGSGVELVGGEFVFDGVALSDGQVGNISPVSNSILTGTFADGTAFAFSSESFDQLLNVTLTEVGLPTIDTTPITISNSSQSSPLSLRAGQTLTLEGTGNLGDNFTAVDAVLNIDGGTVGNGLRAANSVVNISGGELGPEFAALFGTTVNISGGSIGDPNAEPFSDSARFGIIGDLFIAANGSTINISGGNIGNNFFADVGSTVNFFGTSFFLDDIEVTGLAFDEAELVAINGRLDRSRRFPFDGFSTFSGILADGSEFEIDLLQLVNLRLGPDQPGFRSSNVTLTVVSPASVPEPGSTSLLVIGVFLLAARRRR